MADEEVVTEEVPQTETEVIPEPATPPETPALETAPVVEAPKTKIRKVIQPLDGENKPLGAPHVYEGDTLEEVNSKMAEAIANGTRKIHELSRKAILEPAKDPDGAEVEVEAPVWKPRDLTEDEKFLVKTDPEQAWEINFKAKFGMSSAEFAERQKRRDEDSKVVREKAETDMFKDDHPAFVACDENRDAMIQWMLKHPKLAWRKKNLDLAYRELSDGGLLITRPVEAAPVVNEPAPVPEPRTETPVPSVVKPDFPAVIRNNSSRAVAPIKPKDGKPTAEQIANMSAEEWASQFPELSQAR